MIDIRSDLAAKNCWSAKFPVGILSPNAQDTLQVRHSETMAIPVFVSCPSSLTDEQTAARELIMQELTSADLEPRMVQPSDYPVKFPLREVLRVAKHCYGGLILGFQQTVVDSGKAKAGTLREEPIASPISFPSPWNQLETGVLFSLELPILVFKDASISGGVFDSSVNDVSVQSMPNRPLSNESHQAMSAAIQQWRTRVELRFERDNANQEDLINQTGFEGYTGYRRLESQIAWYDRESGKNKKRFHRLKRATLAISVSIPVLSGVLLFFKQLGSNGNIITGSLGAIIALLEGLQQLNQYHQNWISYRSTAEALKHEKFLYLGKAGPYATATNPDALLTETVESLVSQEHAKWSSVQQQTDKKQNGADQTRQGAR